MISLFSSNADHWFIYHQWNWLRTRYYLRINRVNESTSYARVSKVPKPFKCQWKWPITLEDSLFDRQKYLRWDIIQTMSVFSYGEEITTSSGWYHNSCLVQHRCMTACDLDVVWLYRTYDSASKWFLVFALSLPEVVLKEATKLIARKSKARIVIDVLVRDIFSSSWDGGMDKRNEEWDGGCPMLVAINEWFDIRVWATVVGCLLRSDIPAGRSIASGKMHPQGNSLHYGSS